MATTTQFLYQYRWGVAALGGAAVLIGGFVLANKNEPVVAVVPVAEVAAPEAKTAMPDVVAVEEVPDASATETAQVVEPVTVPAPVVEAVEPVAEILATAPVAQAAEVAAVEPVVVVEPTTVLPQIAATEEVAVAPAPVAEVAEAAVAEPAVPKVEVAAVVDAPAVKAPTLDLVRVEPGGQAVIAGRAEPNSEVAITIDGQTVGTATVTPKGEFVAIIETEAEPGTQAIQVVSEVEPGVDLVSADTVLILTPEAPVGETAAPTVISAAEETITVLQPGGLAVPDQVSLDSISYDQAGEAILAGRAQPLSEVRVYVDDIFAVSAMTSDSGAWTTPLNQVAAGRYILRVDEIGPDGAVTSRAQTPFQKEYPENIAPFLQMANGKLTVQPGNTLWVMAREIYGSGIQYTQIFAANKDSIGDPDLIFPGQIFVIPKN